MRNAEFVEKLDSSIGKVERWVEAKGYKGVEPFDGLSSFLRPLALKNLFLERILQQIVRQSPFNLRPLLGIRPQESTKGRGYMAWGYLSMLKLTRNPRYREKAALCLDWLDRNKAPGYSHHSWGNHFPFSGRGGQLPKHEPIIVWTSLIGQVFLDAYETIGDARYLEIAESVCRWILEVPRERTDRGACLSYVAYEQRSIHNSNMLGAAMLARSAMLLRRPDWQEVAKEAMEYSCSRQRPDGSWRYGEADHHGWIDNFHTGYNLDALKRYTEATGDADYREHLEKGLAFYRTRFIEASGRPKYYHNRAYPIDSQCAAQSIETLTHFSADDPSCLNLAVRVADWTIENMQSPKGYFYYRQYPLLKAKTPMLHWAQATTYRALAMLRNTLGPSA